MMRIYNAQFQKQFSTLFLWDINILVVMNYINLDDIIFSINSTQRHILSSCSFNIHPLLISKQVVNTYNQRLYVHISHQFTNFPYPILSSIEQLIARGMIIIRQNLPVQAYILSSCPSLSKQFPLVVPHANYLKIKLNLLSMTNSSVLTNRSSIWEESQKTH